jgi:hypothetical protein
MLLGRVPAASTHAGLMLPQGLGGQTKHEISSQRQRIRSDPRTELQGYCHGARSADMASLPHGPRHSLEALIALRHQTFGMTLCTTTPANDCLLDMGQTESRILPGLFATTERLLACAVMSRCSMLLSGFYACGGSCPIQVFPRSSQAAVVHCGISLSTSRPLLRTITIVP